MSSRPIWGARTNDGDAQCKGSARLLWSGPGTSRPRFRSQPGQHDHPAWRERRRQDHHAAGDLQHGAFDRRDRIRRSAARGPFDRKHRPPRHRACAPRARDLHHDDRGGKPPARRDHPERQGRRYFRHRADVRSLSGPEAAAYAASRDPFRRRTADAGGCPRSDASSEADAAGRAVIRSGAADRARSLQNPRQDQSRGQGHHPGGRAERAIGAGTCRQSVRDRNRTHRDVGQCLRDREQRRRSQILFGLLRRAAMELFTNQVLAGIATGAIYACMALAVVMIYQAIDHLNFAQGEMAMFSTFMSWQMMQWGVPYWGAFILTLALSFVGGIAIERLLFKPLAKAPVLTNVAGFIALFAIVNSVAGLIWDFTIKQYPTPFGSSPFLGSQLISTHQAGMIGVTVLLLILLFIFFQYTRMGLAMRAAASLPESARLVGINTSWMIALGWLTSPLGAVVGGFLVGVFENLAGTYIPGVGNELKLPIALALIITVLVLKPAGLFGRPIVKRV